MPNPGGGYQFVGGEVAGLPTPTLYSQLLPFDGPQDDMGFRQILGPIQFAPDVSKPINKGAYGNMSLEFNGTDLPTFVPAANGKTIIQASTSLTPTNTAGFVYRLDWWSDDAYLYYSWSTNQSGLVYSGPKYISSSISGLAPTKIVVTMSSGLVGQRVPPEAFTVSGSNSGKFIKVTGAVCLGNSVILETGQTFTSQDAPLIAYIKPDTNWIQDFSAFASPNWGPTAVTNAIAGTTLPGAPTGAAATAGNTTATVTFTAPASTGGSPIIGYTVTASTGQIATGASSPIVVPGLTNGVPVTFTVTATTAVGTGPASAPTTSVTPSTGFSISGSAPAGTVGTAYTATYTASGGVTPYTYSVFSGALPAGVTLASSTGVLSGTPTTATSYAFVIRATDSTSGTPQTVNTSTQNVTVSAAGASITGTAPAGTVGVAYTYTYTATGFVGAITWSVGSGSLPAGVTLATSTGIISGTPTTAAAYTFVIHGVGATSGSANSPSQSVTIGASGSASITGTAPAGVVGTAYSFDFTCTGFVGAITPSLTSGSLPAGLALSYVSPNIRLSGTPTAAATSTFVVHGVGATSGTADSPSQSVVVSASGSLRFNLLSDTSKMSERTTNLPSGSPPPYQYQAGSGIAFDAQGTDSTHSMAGDGNVEATLLNYVVASSSFTMIALDDDATNDAYANWKFVSVQSDASFQAFVNGATEGAPSGVVTMANFTVKHRIIRTVSTGIVKAQYSTDSGGTWTDYHTFTATSTASLRAKGSLYAISQMGIAGTGFA